MFSTSQGSNLTQILSEKYSLKKKKGTRDIETMLNNSEKLGFFCLSKKFSFCLEVQYLFSGASYNQAAESQAVIEQLILAFWGA